MRIKQENYEWKQERILLITTVFALLALGIGPMDIFSHGFYCDTLAYDQIYEEDQQWYPLLEQSYSLEFIPAKRHFAGFSLYFGDMGEEQAGELVLEILNGEGRSVDQATVDLSQVQSRAWHQIYMNQGLRVGERYTLHIRTKNRQIPLQLLLVDQDYLPAEQVKGNLFIGYAYSKSTFEFPEKVLILLFLTAGWLFAIGKSKLFPCRGGIGAEKAAIFLFLTALLTWNYSFSSMNHTNGSFLKFHVSGEMLVMGCVYAEHEGIPLSEYGLGRYTNMEGTHIQEKMEFLTDESWEDGYSRTEPMVAIPNHPFTQRICVAGNHVRFANGDEFAIEQTSEQGGYLYITLSSHQRLQKGKYGSLSDIQIFKENGEACNRGQLEDYTSQFGLQGKVFRTLARYMDYENIFMNLRLLCSLGTAVVFVLLVLAIAYKYGNLFAFSFYVVFWLSPWVVNFAYHLYWVEFTWFLPMLIGIACSIWIENRRFRLFCYGAVFIAVMGKSLCGYEYITNVMLGGIVFLILDYIQAVLERDKQKGTLLLRTTFWFGLFSLLGFFAAIFIHARLRGNGDVLAGIQSILEQDVLRRVGGGELSSFDQAYWDSLNASIWETLGKYFHFSTEIIAGVPGNVFPLLCAAPIGIFIYNYKRKTINWRDVWMYLVFFATSVSWFVLAKPHSYNHFHLNYVLWYFGFVQICFYIICKQVIGKEYHAL
ncbi:MAG: hypothetical protein HFI31_08580 [Lachnospiraceae bacterium]|nr:hypothetical protein [Lachnospiraceae bacterium]